MCVCVRERERARVYIYIYIYIYDVFNTNVISYIICLILSYNHNYSTKKSKSEPEITAESDLKVCYTTLLMFSITCVHVFYTYLVHTFIVNLYQFLINIVSICIFYLA